jgi:hypothetical protein
MLFAPSQRLNPHSPHDVKKYSSQTPAQLPPGQCEQIRASPTRVAIALGLRRAPLSAYNIGRCSVQPSSALHSRKPPSVIGSLILIGVEELLAPAELHWRIVGP